MCKKIQFISKKAKSGPAEQQRLFLLYNNPSTTLHSLLTGAYKQVQEKLLNHETNG